MKIEPLKLGEITAKLPVIQGGMGVGISLGGLAGAVAKEGGIGIISAAQIGYREPDFDRDPKAANLRAITTEYEKARKISPDGVIGFNLMVAMKFYEDYVREVIKAGADLIISGAGLPMDLPRIAKKAETEYKRDRKVLLAPIVSTEKSARVILRYWDRKYQRIPDLLVIEGPLAGGHLGFTKDQLEHFGKDSYEEEIRNILEAVREFEEKYGRKIPAALAGGIEGKEQVKRAFELGADAVQVATRFVTTEECDADIRYKEAYIKAEKEDIIIVKSPVGMPGRAIRNAFMERVIKEGKIPHSPCHQCLHSCNPKEIPYCITDALINAARGETEQALLFCGAYAYKAKRIETVKEVIASLLPEPV